MSDKPNQMRVCHISTVHPLSDVRVFYRQCCSLVEAGYEVHLVIRAETAEVRNGVHIHPLQAKGGRLRRMLVMPWVALRAALKTKASIYHYHDPELMAVGFILRWLFRKNVVFDVHESVPRQILGKGYLGPVLRRIVSRIYRVVEPILTLGQSLIIANATCMDDYSRKKRYLVQNYPLVTEATEEIARSRAVNKDKPLLVYLGGVSDVRGASVYVELARRLRANGRDFSMQIMGPYDPQLGARLKDLIQQHGLTDAVALPGRVDWYQAMQIVANATVGLCLLLPIPNYTTCLATKIIEYMMLGVPVLASDFDCWRQFVEGERVGLMADPTDLDQVLATCEKLLDSGDELERMGRRGMQAVRSKYNWSREFAELLRCYDELSGADRTQADAATETS